VARTTGNVQGVSLVAAKAAPAKAEPAKKGGKKAAAASPKEAPPAKKNWLDGLTLPFLLGARRVR
jgi:hypothetical protein